MVPSVCRPLLFLLSLVLAQVALLPTYVVGEDTSALQGSADFTLDVRDKRAIHVTNERFLSFALPLGLLSKHWKNFDLSSSKLQTMTRALSPAYLRLGGAASDFLLFKNQCNESHDLRDEGPAITRPEIYMCPQDWDQINEFCAKTGLKLIFGLNLMLRTKDGRWDPSNAETLLDYNTHSVDWELGNEPNNFGEKSTYLSGEQIAADFNELLSLLRRWPKYDGASVYGPDVCGVGSNETTFMLDGFLGSTRATNATTFHSYYLNGRTATVDDFLDPDTLDGLLPDQIKLVTSLVADHYGQRAPVWLGESGNAFDSGAANISDRFVAGFLLLDKLGMSAKMGLDLVIYQDYYGGRYTMLNLDDLDPQPNFWIAYIYKILVGPQVLQTKMANISRDRRKAEDKNYVRMYAHCASRTSGYYQGAVTLIVLNMHRTEPANITLTGRCRQHFVYQYLLTPHGSEGMTSPLVELNGRLLGLKGDGSLPRIRPVRIDASQPILLPPLTYGFYVVQKAKADACLTRPAI